MSKLNDASGRGDVGVLFVDLLFALVVVELLDPMRNPLFIAAEGWWQIGLTFVLTLLSWIGYHLSLSRSDEPIHIDAPPFVHLVLDVVMVATYWLCAVSFERIGARYSWWLFPNPSAVPEAIFVAFAFALYVAWDWTARWIHGPWGRGVSQRIKAGERTPYGKSIDVWDDEQVRRWKRRSLPTAICLAISLIILVVAVTVQQVSTDHTSPGRWVVGLDIALMATLVGFRTGKESISYPSKVNGTATGACVVVAFSALIIPAIS